jgi:hypothetical protein
MIKIISYNLKTILTVSGLIIFILSLKRFYTEALTYNPGEEIASVAFHYDRQVKEQTITGTKKTEGLRPDFLNVLFGIEKVKISTQPPVVIAPPPPPPPENPPQMVLKGIVLEPDGGLRAYIEVDGKRIISLRAGEGVDNITVTDIKERSVSLRWKDQIVELSIEQKRR